MKNRVQMEHNTYLVTGSTSGSLPLIRSALEDNLGIALKGNPDFWHNTFTLFTIDDARSLKGMLAMKPFGERRALILEALQLTTEAQQAILKLSEELTKDSYLFILVPTLEQILPTLRSRFIHLAHSRGEDVPSQDAEEFLRVPWKDRQKIIESLVKAKNQREAYLLLEHIEITLARRKSREGLFEILEAKKRILEGVIPLKIILESALLVLPK